MAVCAEDAAESCPTSLEAYAIGRRPTFSDPARPAWRRPGARPQQPPSFSTSEQPLNICASRLICQRNICLVPRYKRCTNFPPGSS